jgi:hypothetical protein
MNEARLQPPAEKMHNQKGLRRPSKPGSGNILAYFILIAVSLFSFSIGVFYQFSTTNFGNSNEPTVVCGLCIFSNHTLFT